MPRIEWDKTFSVNNIEIDNQHKKWIEIHNDIHEMLVNGDVETVIALAEKSLDAMLQYAKFHFGFEEQFMNNECYPGFIEHRRFHEKFEEELVGLVGQIREGKTVLNTKVLTVVKEWLVDHILNQDKKYSEFIENKRKR